jgi:NhaP-type Na+/H+ or K+/H+ antiporter
MSTISPPDVAGPIAIEAIVGVAIGAVIGMLMRILTKRELRGAIVSAGLGAVGFIAGAIGTALMPWRQNTVTYRMGDTIVSTTTKRFQHPYQVAFVLAIFLPLLWELFRTKRHRSLAKVVPSRVRN